VIASSAFFVLDAILNWPVANYDGSWSQWGQMSANAANGGKLQPDSPLQTDVPSRSELVVYNYNDGAVPTIGAITFTGTGLNDLSTGGTYSGTIDRKFRIQIDGIGAPDTFRWTKDSGANPIVWDASTVTITGAAQTLTDGTTVDGITVTFAATTGHTLNDRWDFSVPTNRRAVEALALDGSVCSGRYNLNGTTTLSSSCTPLLPNSYATGNEIEMDDAAYFGVGGGSSGGGGGGGPIAPGY
jgi:hypothetical protein